MVSAIVAPQEAESERLQIQGQFGLQNTFQVNLGDLGSLLSPNKSFKRLRM